MQLHDVEGDFGTLCIFSDGDVIRYEIEMFYEQQCLTEGCNGEVGGLEVYTMGFLSNSMVRWCDTCFLTQMFVDLKKKVEV